MALSITSTYAGEFAGKYIAAALLSGNTISKGGIEVRPNIKYKEVVKKVVTSGLIVDATCDFTSAGNITLTERIIQPEEFQVNNEFCLTPFISDWEATSMGYSAYEKLPPKFSDFIIAHVAAEVAQKTEQNIWQGVNATAGEFDGLVTLASNDGSIGGSVTGTTVTNANVVAEMAKVIDAAPSAIYGKDDLKLYVSQNVAQAYIRALGGFANVTNGIDNKSQMWYSGQELSFDGVQVFLAEGMADNTMMLAQKSNLWFGTGLLNDQQVVKTLDMGDLDGSQNVRVIMRFTSAVQYGISGDIVVYCAAC